MKQCVTQSNTVASFVSLKQFVCNESFIHTQEHQHRLGIVFWHYSCIVATAVYIFTISSCYCSSIRFLSKDIRIQPTAYSCELNVLLWCRNFADILAVVSVKWKSVLGLIESMRICLKVFSLWVWLFVYHSATLTASHGKLGELCLDDRVNQCWQLQFYDFSIFLSFVADSGYLIFL